ncbi:hypothetical protein AAC387_Pa04g0483 [Persea americana]
MQGGREACERERRPWTEHRRREINGCREDERAGDSWVERDALTRPFFEIFYTRMQEETKLMWFQMLNV